MFAPELRRIFQAIKGSDLIAHSGSDTYISDSLEAAWNKYSPAYHDVFPDAASEGFSMGVRRCPLPVRAPAGGSRTR